MYTDYYIISDTFKINSPIKAELAALPDDSNVTEWGWRDA